MVTAEPQLHLRWHSHSTTFTAMLKALHEDSAYSDLKIICEGGEVMAHKAVLSLCSPYLGKLLTDKHDGVSLNSLPGAHACTTLVLPEIPVQDIIHLVSFIYCGQVDVPQTHLSSFLNTGKHLHVLGLEQGDRLVESPEPSESTESWCGGDGVSEDDTVTSSSLPLSRSSTPTGATLPLAPLRHNLPHPLHQQHHQVNNQEGSLQNHQEQSDHNSQLSRLHSSNTNDKSLDSRQSSADSDVNANLTVEDKTDAVNSANNDHPSRETFVANGIRMKQEAAEEERECPLNPQISIKEERMSEREEDEEQHPMVDLKHSLFSSVTNPPGPVNPAEQTTQSSEGDGVVPAATVAAFASFANFNSDSPINNYNNDSPMNNFGADNHISSSSSANAPNAAVNNPGLSGIIGSDGRIDLNYYLQQAIQYASMPCPLCKKEFKSQSGLRDHIRLHTGERPFICEFCHMNFARASHLKRHRRMHTGEKPFECPVCGKDFSRGDKLKDHLKRHEADDKLNKIRKQLMNPEDCANESLADSVSTSSAMDMNSDKTLGADSNKKKNANSSVNMVMKLASTAAAAAASVGGSAASVVVGDSLNNIGERVANLTARANPQAVTPDSIMSAKTSVGAAANALQQRQLQQQQQHHQQQRLQQIQQHQQTLLQQQQQNMLQQQLIRQPPASVSLSLPSTKRRKLSSSNLIASSPSASHPLLTSPSLNELVNAASLINSNSPVSASMSLINNSNSPVSASMSLINNSNSPVSASISKTGAPPSNAALFGLLNKSGNSAAANRFPGDASAVRNSVPASVANENVIPQMLAMANIGECELKPIN